MAGAGLSTKNKCQVNNWLNIAQSIFWPSSCVLCGANDPDGRDLCQPCAMELPYLGLACHVCGLKLSFAGLCGQCQTTPRAFDQTFAMFEYRAPVDRMILGLKFNSHLYYGRILGQMMAQRLMEGGVDRPQCIIPVPLHDQRLRERGFNQAYELARPVARAVGIPIKVDICRRVRITAAQTGLDAGARRQNLKQAFAANVPVGLNHVAILDDVMTTGSTVEALATELKQAGVGRVDVWLCARAGRRA